MAGLTAARLLTQRGWVVTLLDKGRGAGGRMATRRIENARADHGAQYLTAQTPAFAAHLAELRTAGVVREWPVAGGYVPGAPPYLAGVGGMNGVAKYLANGLNVRTGQKAVRIDAQTGGWSVATESGETYRADALISTLPAPQALTLLADSGLPLESADRSALSAITYQPGLAMLIALNELGRITQPGALLNPTPDVAWLADNRQKGVSDDQPSVTLLASADFSRAHLDGDLDAAGQTLIRQVADFVPAEAVTSVQVHRWRYSLADVRHSEPFLSLVNWAAPLLLGGDGFGPFVGVENAFLSGRAMTERLLSRQ